MLKTLVKFSLLLVLMGFIAVAGAITGAYYYVAASLPRVDTLEDYQPPVISSVYSDDGTVIAEFYKERRIVVPVSEMPEQLIQAFVSAEDSNFFEHQGIDIISIFRAALKNVKAGGIVQGGSTITQQVAKSLLLTPEKKFSRKFKEAILAWRMEQALSKEEILYLYLNQIYLGHAAYGVQAAAENYFAKDVSNLSLAECSILAGLPQAPSRYSPYRHYDRARERQKYVLGRMVIENYISKEDAEAALEEQLKIHPRVNTHIKNAVYFTQQVRRYLEKNYGEKELYTGGLQIYTSMNLSLQMAAHNAVRKNLHNHDKRQGFRGAIRTLSKKEEIDFHARLEKKFAGKAPLPDDLFEAVITREEGHYIFLQAGTLQGVLDTKKTGWARLKKIGPRPAEIPDSSENKIAAEGKNLQLSAGSVVLVTLTGEQIGDLPELRLEQTPLAQGAIIALEPNSGMVKAMVGGYQFSTSKFNRVIQARRLPGSAVKPLIYAAAMDKGYTPATVILDTPLIYRETGKNGKKRVWKPKNYGKKFYGATTFRNALTHSYNVITIKILEDIGISYTISYLRKLGIKSDLNRDLTLGLGSSAVTPIEMATAYSVFASGGIRTEPSYIISVRDRHGNVLESINPADFPNGPGAGQKLVQQKKERVISRETAWLTTNLLESVVRNGTGWRAKALRRPTAGKTGTTNDLKDAWFIGYIPQLVAVSWVGYDQERPLGKNETGSKAAAPAWVSFMQEAIKMYPEKQFTVPDSIEFHPVDPKTGFLTTEDSEEMNMEAFAPGTAPSEYVGEQNGSKASDFFRLELEN